jgi:hypothetical protein
MKQRTSTKWMIQWIVVALVFAVQAGRAQIIDIPDPGLQTTIRMALNKPADDITLVDMESVTVLDASRQTRGESTPLISSLQGLESSEDRMNGYFEAG